MTKYILSSKNLAVADVIGTRYLESATLVARRKYSQSWYKKINIGSLIQMSNFLAVTSLILLVLKVLAQVR